jgi:hypothetical protein
VEKPLHGVMSQTHNSSPTLNNPKTSLLRVGPSFSHANINLFDPSPTCHQLQLILFCYIYIYQEKMIYSYMKNVRALFNVLLVSFYTKMAPYIFF